MQIPGEPDHVLTRLHPDARLDAPAADSVCPDRNGMVEVKTFDPKTPRWHDLPATPAVREQRISVRAISQRGIRLRENQPAAKRRLDRSDQQAVITAREGPRNRPGGVTATPIRDPPFATLCFSQCAANGAPKADRFQ